MEDCCGFGIEHEELLVLEGVNEKAFF